MFSHPCVDVERSGNLPSWSGVGVSKCRLLAGADVFLWCPATDCNPLCLAARGGLIDRQVQVRILVQK